MIQAAKLMARGRLAEIKTELEKLNLLAESDLESILLAITIPYRTISSVPIEKLSELIGRLSETIKKVRALEAEAEQLEANLK